MKVLLHPRHALYGSDLELANTWMNTYDNSVSFKVTSNVEWISTAGTLKKLSETRPGGFLFLIGWIV
jgi:hypothetical protein